VFELEKKFLSSVSYFMFSLSKRSHCFCCSAEDFIHSFFVLNVKTGRTYFEEKSYLIAQGVSVSVLCVSGENLISVDSRS